jgi:hypothetical protein
MLAATEDWQEFLRLSVLAYLGPRRDSVSRLRWRDVDLAEGTIRFLEKRSKVAVKPMPNELGAILREGMESAAISCGPDDYVIPNRRPASVRRAERSSKVIWETVKRVGKRVGVRATTHSFQRAFAVAFLTSSGRNRSATGADESLANRYDANLPSRAEQIKGDGGGPRPLVGPRVTVGCRGGAYGIRTRATAVRGRRPRPLDECARRALGTESRKANGGR